MSRMQSRLPLTFILITVLLDAIGIGLVDGVDEVTRDVFAVRFGNAQVACHFFESMAGQVAGGEVVTEHGVQGIDQLSAGHDEANAAAAGPLAEPGGTDASEREGDAEEAGAMVEEGEVEALQVVIFDDVGVGGLDFRDEPADQIGFVGAFEELGVAVGVSDGDEEDAAIFRREAGSFEVELEAPEMVEGELAEVGASGGDEVLFFGGEGEDRLLAQFAEMAHATSTADGGGEGRAVLGGEKVAEGTGAVELSIVQGWQVVNTVEEEPGPEASFFSDQRICLGVAPPEDGPPVCFGPDGNDAWRGIPAPEPLFVHGIHFGKER